ncbi:MAG: metal-dependent transcriptional regulator [Verrucomicrobiales bacterium]|nr:metal-dependent transcriptional regulator [Verrucomicrobiales bacterium]
MATSTVENYLKAILHLAEDEAATISVGSIAKNLTVTPGTVSAMMKHLSDEKLVDYVPRRSVALTAKGKRQALQVVRRHRLIETFLVQVMGLDWAEVHEEAEVLEHVVSGRLLARMDEMLGYPRYDPHGDPIPNENGEYADPGDLQPLAEVTSGRFRLLRVDDSDSDLLDWLQSHQLLPGREYEIISRDSIAGVMEILVPKNRSHIQIGEKAASRILVEPVL